MATNSNNGNKKISAKAKARKKRKRVILFVVEIFVLLIMVIVLYGVLKGEKVQRVTIDEEDIVFNEGVQNSETLKGYRNIALFGVDARNGALGKGTRTDTIMVASINEETKEVKIVSVYRDTFLNQGNDSYNKANATYAKGGPEAAITMLNMNLDLNITDFVTVGFSGLVDTIDALGGVMIEVDEAEIDHLNNYQICIAEDLGLKDYEPVKNTGTQLLNGLQATAYCRIRYTAGNDFKRTARQREVLMATAEKAKTASPSTINSIADRVFPQVATSLELDEILKLLKDVASYSVVDNSGFPFDLKTGSIGKKGSCVVPADLDSNVKQLHEFLFNETTYEVSSDVSTFSNAIKSETSSYIGSKPVETP